MGANHPLKPMWVRFNAARFPGWTSVCLFERFRLGAHAGRTHRLGGALPWISSPIWRCGCGPSVSRGRTPMYWSWEPGIRVLGTSLNRAVVERVIGTYDLPAFDQYLRGCSDDERFAILRDLVEGASPSQGYQCLAELIRAGCFNVILSTNFDPLLEDAIAGVQMRRRDYVFLVHGVMAPDFIADHLGQTVPEVKILKLHGDLFYYKFYYTGEEIDVFPGPISAGWRPT